MAGHRFVAGAAALTLVLAATPAGAQPVAEARERPAPVVEGALGWAGFGDEGVIHHTLVGGGARYYVWPRVSLGPELQYMVGPGQDRDLILTGNLVLDVFGPRAGRPRRATPYLVLGGGLFHHSDRFGGSTEGAFTAGPGLRVWLSDRTFVAADARIGWEPHLRLAAVLGVALR
jgi:hypothetical protein